MRRLVVLFALLALACTSTRDRPHGDAEKVEPAELPRGPEPTTEAPARPAEAVDPVRWACARDEDCTQTCGLGAVSRAWLEQNPDADACDDGCGWNHDLVRCRARECVTLEREDGGINEGCTRLERPLYE